ncbi:MAG: hypothetical protein MNPFHGCM_00670 [Gemmatimonadaceae bacterium]|nr:hypothetical protein [Gemmatimonadaceae bacterium]
MPPADIAQRALRRPQWFRDDQYVQVAMAQQAREILAAGGRVVLGGHRQMQGLGVHWEMWSLASGGMAPLDVIRVGTILGAERSVLAATWDRSKPGSWPTCRCGRESAGEHSQHHFDPLRHEERTSLRRHGAGRDRASKEGAADAVVALVRHAAVVWTAMRLRRLSPSTC